jgi:TonB family protein
MSKHKAFITAALLLFSGCALFSASPSSVVKQLISDAQKGDVDGIVSRWASKAIQEQGADKVRENAERFAALNRQARAAGEDLEIQNIRETIQGDRARVFFLYRDRKGTDSVAMGFALVKENGKWRIYRTADQSESFDSSFAGKSSPKESLSESTPTMVVTPPPSVVDQDKKPTSASVVDQDRKPSLPSTSSANAVAAKPSGPISGGVMNSKAVSLPKPAYPPAAKAVKASGAVVVQITVDESGKVVSATAVSGHPLLRQAAANAARAARFRPTLLGGQPVKVNGTVTYEFSPQ